MPYLRLDRLVKAADGSGIMTVMTPMQWVSGASSRSTISDGIINWHEVVGDVYWPPVIGDPLYATSAAG